MEIVAALNPEKAKDIKAKIEAVARKYGYKAYAVGGYVRDELLGRQSKDLDIVAIKDEDGINAGINLAKLIAQEYGYHEPVIASSYGTALLQMDGEGIDFVAPRKEQYDPNSRKPQVERGTLADDARRRDFTVNALYQDLGTGEITDPTGHGLEDIKNKVIRVTDAEDPDVIFSEDPLRSLRAIRQSYSLGFTLDEATKEAVKRNVARLDIISRERVRDEFSKILTGPKPSEAIRLMRDIGLTKQFIPELDETFGVTQDSKWHQETVDEHILSAVDMVPSTLADRLVALLHDISKPAKKSVVDGIAHFYGHEDVGAETAKAILERLKFPNDVIEEVVFRVKNHMRPHNNPKKWGPKAVRKFMKDMGEYLDRVLDFAETDIKSAVREEGEDGGLEALQDLRTRIEQEKAQGVSPLPTAPLLNGDELKNMFARPAGPWIGELHRYLFDLQLENPALTRDEAIAKAKEYMENKDAQEKPQDEGKQTEAHLEPGHVCTCGTCHCDKRPRTIIVGACGFNHADWEGSFYPRDVKESEKLLYYARHIPSVEIAATAHLLPATSVFERWAAQTPKEFTFSFRMMGGKNLGPNMDMLFDRCLHTIGLEKMAAVSIIIPENRPFKKGDVFRMYESMPAFLYAFDLQSAAWVCDEAYKEIEECGGTIVRDNLRGGRIAGHFDYVRLPVYRALREAKFGTQLRVFASDHVLDPQKSGEAFIYVEPSDEQNPIKTIKDLLNIYKRPYQPSPVDLTDFKQKHMGPTNPGDPFTGPNNSALPVGDSSRIYGPHHQQEEEAVDIRGRNLKKPGDETLTPTTTFDFADGSTNTDGKIDKGY